MKRSARVLGLAMMAAAVAKADDGVLIRSSFEPGQRLHYAWHLEQENRWVPPREGADWGAMSTDFDFVLTAEHVSSVDTCTFILSGNGLKSVARGPKGGLGVDATATEASWLLGSKWTKPGPRTPLSKFMSLTLGPRFNVTGSSGLEAIALYFLPSVDYRVWFALMTAPEGPIAPGQKENLKPSWYEASLVVLSTSER